MKHYPGAEYEFERFDARDCMTYPDGSAAVFCRLTIDGITREMSLPVMDHRHRAIKANADGSGGPDAQRGWLWRSRRARGVRRAGEVSRESDGAFRIGAQSLRRFRPTNRASG